MAATKNQNPIVKTFKDAGHAVFAEVKRSGGYVFDTLSASLKAVVRGIKQ